MSGIKKTIVILSIVCLLLTSSVISVGAATVAPVYNTGDPSKFSSSKICTYTSLYCQGSWGWVTTKASDHKDSRKKFEIYSYYYSKTIGYYYQDKDIAIGTDLYVISYDGATVNGSTGCVKYVGSVYGTASASSGVLQKATVYCYRSGLPKPIDV